MGSKSRARFTVIHPACAVALGLPVEVMSRAESGTHGPHDGRLLARLARAYGMTGETCMRLELDAAEHAGDRGNRGARAGRASAECPSPRTRPIGPGAPGCACACAAPRVCGTMWGVTVAHASIGFRRGNRNPRRIGRRSPGSAPRAGPAEFRAIS